MSRMRSGTVASRVPDWSLGDRIRKAIETSDLSVQDVADHLEKHRNAVSTWIHGRHAPSPLELREIADLTGVSVQWLRWGVVDTAEALVAQRIELPPSKRKAEDVRRSYRATRRRLLPVILPPCTSRAA
jgi:transcriptional regulator with XRE-family HTH domain